MSQSKALRFAWLTEVPQLWQVRRFAWLGKWKGGGTPSKSNSTYWGGEIPWVSPKDMKVRVIHETLDYVTLAGVHQSSASIVPPNSVLIVTRSGILRHSLPVAVTSRPMAINQDLKALLPNTDVDAKFVAYWIEANQDALLSLWRKEGTTVESLETYLIRETPVPLPPYDQQRAIATFLDRETARIDTLIEKKQRLLDLLEEKRDSRIAEIIAGRADYPLVKLGYLIDILSGYAFQSSDYTTSQDDVRLLRGTNVGIGRIDWSETARWPKDEAERYSRWYLSEGDIVFGMDRPWISGGIRVARVQTSDLPALLLQRVARIRPKPLLTADYLELILSSPQFHAYFKPILTGVSVPHISPGQISSFHLRLPPLEQQHAVTAELKGEETETRRLKSKLLESVRLLAELRSSTISAAVTGKIDVTEPTLVLA